MSKWGMASVNKIVNHKKDAKLKLRHTNFHLLKVFSYNYKQLYLNFSL